MNKKVYELDQMPVYQDQNIKEGTLEIQWQGVLDGEEYDIWFRVNKGSWKVTIEQISYSEVDGEAFEVLITDRAKKVEIIKAINPFFQAEKQTFLKDIFK